MHKLLATLITGMAAFGCAANSIADSSAAKAAYYAAADKAAADYRDAHAQCDILNMNAQTICIEEAKLSQTRTKATAEAQYKNTDQARLKARTDIANAEYAVANEKCKLMEHSDKDACIRQAERSRLAAIAEGKAGRKTMASKNEALQETKRDSRDVGMEK